MTQYRDLDVANNEIRLVRLLSAYDKARLIECELIYIPLDRTVLEKSYEALSYTWGDNAAGHSILLNGDPFNVTDNLHAALSELRLQDRSRYLWVDAVCINQCDIPERNREVLRMLNIYQNAKQVLVWLGPGTSATGTAMEHLVRLEQKWRDRPASPTKRTIRHFSKLLGDTTLFLEAITMTIFNIQDLRDLLLWSVVNCAVYKVFGGRLAFVTVSILLLSQWSLSTIQEFISLFIQNFGDISSTRLAAYAPQQSILTDLKDVFEREWFTRVWIIQEITAASYAVVQCGPHQISWDTLSAACNQLAYETSLSWTRHPYADTRFQGAFNLTSTIAIDGLSTTAVREKRSLLSLLSEFNVAKATRAHDKVYGLLGLASEVRGTITSGQTLEPHYEYPVELVYIQVARYLIESSNDLRVLCACMGVGDLVLPSWVPDWSYAAWRQNEGSHECFQISDHSNTIPVAEFSDCRQKIIVKGFVAGALKDEITAITADNLRDMRLSSVIIGTFMMPILAILMHPLTWVMCGWLCTHLISRLEPRLGAELYSISDHNRRMLLKKRKGMQTVSRATFQEDESTVSLQQKRSSRRFRTTGILDFIYINWACHTWATEAKEGDLVCMFRGAIQPMLLRPREGDDWQLVGPATYSSADMFVWERAVKLHSKSRLPLNSFIIT